MSTYAAALSDARLALKAAGVDSPSLDARLLMSAAADLDAAALIARSGDELPPLAETRFRSHLKRRLAGEPVARILGEKEFWGLSFVLHTATLVPRPETETLVAAVLDEARARFRPDLTIGDLGAGSGAILIALLSELPEARGTATDISADALGTARLNAERLGVFGRMSFHLGDFAEGPAGPFHVVVTNPPYIRSGDIDRLRPEVRDHDPPSALDGGPDGLAAYRTILRRASELLRPDGLIAMEVGYDQDEDVARLCRVAGLSDVAIRHDLAGIARVVLGRLAKAEPSDALSKKGLENAGDRASVAMRTRAEAREMALPSARQR